MNLKFSHVDIIVSDLDKAVEYYRRVLSCKASELQIWNRNGFHVEYRIMFNGAERFYLVQPIAGNLKDMLEEKGGGTIYRLCYTVPDMDSVYSELVASGVEPQDENGKPLARENLSSPNGARIIWLPKQFGTLSIELLETAVFEERMERLRSAAT
jgi:methylmalonyl-CoA/ethylmalonyl-CoA epimerase